MHLRAHSSSTHSIRIFVLFFTAWFALAFQAQASEELVAKYQVLAKQHGGELKYGRLETLGPNSFILNEIEIIGGEMKAPLRISRVTIEGVKELTGNGLSADRLLISGLSFAGENETGEQIFITLASAISSNLYVPDPTDESAPLFTDRNVSVEAREFDVTIDGNKAFTMPSISSRFDVDSDGKVYDGFFKMLGGEFFPDALKNKKAKLQLARLGYETLKLDVNLEMKMDLASGELDLTRYEFDMADIGALDIALKIGGYTEAFALALRNESNRINSLPVEERQKASGELFAKIAQLTLNSARISFVDKSITNKVIAMQAEASGQSPEDMKMMAPIMLSAALTTLEKPDFASMLVGAVQTFLANPGTIALSANPERPIGFGELFTMGVAVPNLLIDTLNVSAENK